MALAHEVALMATPKTTPILHTSEKDEWYKVYTPEFDTVAYDPLDPPKRYHTGIFIEKDTKTSSGDLFQVTGDVIAASGMRFDVKENYRPTEDGYFHRMEQVGCIHKADFPRVRAILEALPTPPKQQGIDFWSKGSPTWNQIVWTKENGDLYGPGEQRRPIMKCNEWTHQLAIPKLQMEGILHSSN